MFLAALEISVEPFQQILCKTREGMHVAKFAAD